MRFFRYAATIMLLAVFLALSVYVFKPESGSSEEYVSPLPPFLTLKENDQVRLLDLWLPFIQQIQGNERDLPEFTAKSVLMYDLTTGKTLFEHNATQKMPMASLTKIMTAIVALENKREDDRYIVHSFDLVGENSMGLSQGEELSLEELLYGLMLPSGNDAAEVLASNHPYGREAFLEAMNNKAKALGLMNTRFSNASGLQGDGEQFTTAHDQLVITKYMLDTYPLLRKIVSTYEYILPATETHKEYVLYNETNLLTTYPGVKGVKTGYTPEAGLCLVTYLEYNGHRIVGIILNSENRREEMKQFLDYSLYQLGITPPPHS